MEIVPNGCSYDTEKLKIENKKNVIISSLPHSLTLEKNSNNINEPVKCKRRKSRALLEENRFAQRIEDMVEEHLKYSRPNSDDDWKVVSEEGDMKVFIREVEEDGAICDPVKAVTTVKGVSAREMCHLYFDPSVRMLWETSIESSEVVEAVEPSDTLVYYQRCKRIWPAAQRDTLCLTHIRPIPAETELVGGADGVVSLSHPGLDWMVVNFSIDDDDFYVPLGGCVRARVQVSMTCRTVVAPEATGADSPQDPEAALAALSRDQIACDIVYQSFVDFGGWAPAAATRAVAKKEYPKFVKKFSQFVKNQTKDLPIMF